VADAGAAPTGAAPSGAAPSGAAPSRVALVLTVSDGVAAGTREDTGGARVAERVAAAGFTVSRAAVSDEPASIVAAIRAGIESGARLIVTTGGTGLGPRDRTPEALRTILELDVPGLGEQMRAAGRASTPLADLSRSLAGVIGSSLVVAVPGSPGGAVESFDAVAPVLDHALELLAGRTQHTPGDG
jgi:molybdenum cofactor synthesis domain-containing protein